jgi:hypothetical protein
VDIDKFILKSLGVRVLDRRVLVEVCLDDFEEFVREREGIDRDVGIDGFNQLFVGPLHQLARESYDT